MNSHSLLSCQSSNCFQYQLLPSAFKIAECPTYLCWKSLKFSESLWNRNSANNWEQLKNRGFAVLVGMSGYLGGIVALPLTVSLTPITLLADIVIGIAECLFCLYKGLAKNDLLIIAHRKLVISPCQHLTFCLGVITGLGVIWLFVSVNTLNPWLGFKCSLVFWTFGYASGQIAVGSLPTSLNHHSLNIFIGGGSGDNEQEKWLDSHLFAPNINGHEQPRSNPFSQAESISLTNWQEFINKEILFVSHVDDANLAIQYINFKRRLLRRCNPQELMELSNNFNQRDLQKKYRELSLFIHPDKNQPREQEATALFKVLNRANELLRQQ